jgi:hypothetical protein
MAILTGVVLTEIVGRDVISWRVTPDSFHELTYSVDTADVPGVVVIDAEGRIKNALVIRYAPANKTIVQFKTRSECYALLYRRNNVVEERDGTYYYNDSWRYQGQRFQNWFFPPQAQFTSLTPPALEQQRGWWRGQILISHVTPGISIQARYRLDAPAVAPPPADREFDFAEMLRLLTPPDGAEAEALRQATAAAPEFETLLAGSTALRALLAGDPVL